jgi:hypothetical protein
VTPICEMCKGNVALLIIRKVDGLTQADELVCVHCAYAMVSRVEVGVYALAVIKGVQQT